ncbi:MAG: hypothetical protein NZT92_01535 [Abditibacteriales bacterium]|nr:hypothetical protein [Abditibacteriales bacterium]MDW8364594.1 hypothetical protein [Abditibacteriales bacterium]
MLAFPSGHRPSTDLPQNHICTTENVEMETNTEDGAQAGRGIVQTEPEGRQ